MKSKKNSKTYKSKKNIDYKKRRRLTFFIIFSFICTSIYFIHLFYIKNRCKDLNYAVEYFLTTGNKEDKLMRVKTMTLVFSDKDKAVIKAYGLNKNEPHGSITIEGHFRKDRFNSWNLENSYKIEN